MFSSVTIIHWNGDDLPEELRALPAGAYVVGPASELVALTPEEEAGIAKALESLDAGRGIQHENVAERIRRITDR